MGPTHARKQLQTTRRKREGDANHMKIASLTIALEIMEIMESATPITIAQVCESSFYDVSAQYLRSSTDQY